MSKSYLTCYSMVCLFQTRKKEEEVESDGPRLNDKIIADTVRLVSEEGILFFHFVIYQIKQTAKDDI